MMQANIPTVQDKILHEFITTQMHEYKECSVMSKQDLAHLETLLFRLNTRNINPIRKAMLEEEKNKLLAKYR